MNKLLLCIFISVLFTLPPFEDLSQETNISHIYNVKTEHIHSNGYEFILYTNGPGAYLESYAHDGRKLNQGKYNNIIYENDTFVLVKKEQELIYYLPESYEVFEYPGSSKEVENTWSWFENADSKCFLKSVEYPKYDVAIFEFSASGVRCCGYLHLFNTKNEFKYLGKFSAFY